MFIPELLAPAGDWSSLNAAINAGANSVYLGVAEMNMRATAAKNFQLSELQEIVNHCHKNNVKVFVTVNTLMYNSDLETMRKIINECKKTNVDAIISADMAAILYGREKGIDVQISTQLSISNIESLKFYSQFADRVVLARELTLEQMKELSEQIEEQDIRGPKGELVELEIFAHGAMCVAVSGRCGMSLFDTGKSANQGKCSQICKRKFKVIDDTGKELIIDNNYVMSAADLCTIGMLPELIEAGANVLKFEGRGRPAEYVDTIIRTYKEALESIGKGEYTEENIKKWRVKLGTEFNRGQSEGLYRGLKFSEWAGTHGSKATKEKFSIGKITNYFKNVGVAEITIQAKEEIKLGEEYLITGETTGAVRGELKEWKVFDVGTDYQSVQDSKSESVGTGLVPVQDSDSVGAQNLAPKKEIEIQSDVAKQGQIITFKPDGIVRRNDDFFVMRKRESLVPRGRELLVSRE